MAIKLRVEVTDEDGTLAEYRVEDADGDVNTAGRLAILVSYAYRAIDPFICGEWDELLTCLVDQAVESRFKSDDYDVHVAFEYLVSASNALSRARAKWVAIKQVAPVSEVASKYGLSEEAIRNHDS